MRVRKLTTAEATAARAGPLRKCGRSASADGDAGRYVIGLDESGGLEGHRVYWTGAEVFGSADGRYEHLCVTTILGHAMPFLVVARDRVEGQVIGHYFAAATEFPIE